MNHKPSRDVGVVLGPGHRSPGDVEAVERLSDAGKLGWVLCADQEAARAVTGRSISAPMCCTAELQLPDTDDPRIEAHVEQIMARLNAHYRDLAHTTNGASWLEAQHVPVTRLLRQGIRKLLALSSWPGYAGVGSVIWFQPKADLVVPRASSAREDRYWTISWPGITYLLAHDAPAIPRPNPIASSGPVSPSCARHSDARPTCARATTVSVIALSWSSRHVGTLRPVIDELVHRGTPCLIIDGATTSHDRYPKDHSDAHVLKLPFQIIAASGGPPLTPPRAISEAVQVERCNVSLSRLLPIVHEILSETAGFTQPSWAAVQAFERFMHEVCRTRRPRVLLCCNDVSPLGYTAVQTAHHAGLETVYLQHAAWAPQEPVSHALHCRHIAVMGDRDIPLARARATTPTAEVHTVGFPRFDTLVTESARHSRSQIETQLLQHCGRTPRRLVLLAPQPGSTQRNAHQLDVLLEALQNLGEDWAAIIALHPAQRPDIYQQRLARPNDQAVRQVVLVPAGVGATQCLAAADVLVTESSTCAIEAILLDVPVVEIALPSARSLRLAEEGAASSCSSPTELEHAIRTTEHAMPISPDLKRRICHWDGNSTAKIVDLVDRFIQGCLQPPTAAR